MYAKLIFTSSDSSSPRYWPQNHRPINWAFIEENSQNSGIISFSPSGKGLISLFTRPRHLCCRQGANAIDYIHTTIFMANPASSRTTNTKRVSNVFLGDTAD
jgi:hypothetical protein